MKASLRPLPMIVLGVFAGIALMAPVLWPQGSAGRLLPAYLPPGLQDGWLAWLGSDDLGRSVLLQSAFALRESLIVTASSLLIALLPGLACGLIAALAPVAWARLAERGIVLGQVLPRFFLAVLVAAFFGPSRWGLALVLGCTSWPLLARMVRIETMSMRQRPWVAAARLDGVSRGRLAVVHVLPHAARPLLGAAAYLAGSVLAADAAIGFVGLGDAAHPGLGRLMAEAFALGPLAPWLVWPPGFLLLALIVSTQLVIELGDRTEIEAR